MPVRRLLGGAGPFSLLRIEEWCPFGIRPVRIQRQKKNRVTRVIRAKKNKTKSVFSSASEGLFVIEIQMPAFLLQQQNKIKNRVICAIRAKN